MKPCTCGQEVRLRGRKLGHGIWNYIEHMDGTPVCVPGAWETVMAKPYPAREEDRPARKMLLRWESS